MPSLFAISRACCKNISKVKITIDRNCHNVTQFQIKNILLT